MKLLISILIISLLSGCDQRVIMKPSIPEATYEQRLAVMRYITEGDIQWLSADLSLAEMRRKK